jgi:predicted RNase H-like nuclease (RuvC/YqgF family)
MMWKIKLAIGLALAIGLFFSGWKTRDAFCDAAEAKRQVRELTRQIEARDEAMKRDATRAAANVKELETLQEAIRGLEGKMAQGECFSADDVERIRSLWLRRG